MADEHGVQSFEERRSGAVLEVRGPVDRRALDRFVRRLDALDGAPAVVVATGRAGSPAPRGVAGPGRVLARTLGVGRGSLAPGADGPTLVLRVDGRRVWEHHGLHRRHLPHPAVLVERAQALRPFARSTAAVEQQAVSAA